jgi:hypothetical protein
MPDYVRITNDDDREVYVKMLDLLPVDGPRPVPAFGPDLVTVVGHRYPNRGFVLQGQDPSSVPTLGTTTTTSR